MFVCWVTENVCECEKTTDPRTLAINRFNVPVMELLEGSRDVPLEFRDQLTVGDVAVKNVAMLPGIIQISRQALCFFSNTLT